MQVSFVTKANNMKRERKQHDPGLFMLDTDLISSDKHGTARLCTYRGLRRMAHRAMTRAKNLGLPKGQGCPGQAEKIAGHIWLARAG